MAILDPVLGWTLLLHPFVAILAISIIVTIISNLIYKWATDQKEMKRLKDQIEVLKKEVKANRENPKKMMKSNNEMMQVNMQYMTRSLKPMLFTFIPVILVIGWMSAHFTYAPVGPSDALTVHATVGDGFAGSLVLNAPTLTTSTVTGPIVPDDDEGQAAAFAVQGPVGVHNFTITYEGKAYDGNTGVISIGENPKVQAFPGKGPIESITVDYPKKHPLGESFNLFGWYPGWLAVYITLSVVLSIGSRKLLKIY